MLSAQCANSKDVPAAFIIYTASISLNEISWLAILMEADCGSVNADEY